MSYDLDFWRYKAGVTLDHQKVCEQLLDRKHVEGVERLPIEAVVRRLNEVFADWTKLDDVTFDGGDRGGFQIFTTPQLLRVTCYGMKGEEMNKLIDIGHGFGCPLYDAQVGRRFDEGPGDG